MNDINIQGLNVRPATNQDQNKIVELVSTILTEYGFECNFATSDNDLLNIEETYFNSGGTFQIIEDEKRNIVGSCALLPITKETCKLRKMYLLPEARGHGLGRYMMQHSIKSAKGLGFKNIMLETATVMQNAINLYIKSGFKEVAQAAQSPRCDRVFVLDLTTLR
jgi:putative acetyltransferase